MFPLFKHQEETIEFRKLNPRTADFSDPGTGKTRSFIESINGRTLILCPKSIMFPAWGADITKFRPDISWVIAKAPHKEAAFKTNADVVITNHDTASWLINNKKLILGFSSIAIDESTAFKHRTAERSKSLLKLVQFFPTRTILTGTPIPNGICDIWHQILLIDDGEHLGSRFYPFRSKYTYEVPGLFSKFVDIPEAENKVFELIKPITIRHKLENCADMPEKTEQIVEFELPKKNRKQYEEFKKECFLEVGNENISAVNAAVLRSKLLQIASGAVYTEEGYKVLDTERAELTLELIKQQKSVVAFNWKHQRDQLIKIAERDKVPYGLIDGSVSTADRNLAVEKFQRGELQFILAHPQSAAHGLTLTKGTATIWMSPSDNAEHFLQFNRRIYRVTQTEKTKTIMISANKTVERRVYSAMNNKVNKVESFLQLFEGEDK